MVQEYFKHGKVQGAAPLSIKTDVNTESMPLGIKTAAQGMKHFTNWNEMSSSMDKQNSLRFEDAGPNSLYYKTWGPHATMDRVVVREKEYDHAKHGFPGNAYDNPYPRGIWDAGPGPYTDVGLVEFWTMQDSAENFTSTSTPGGQIEFQDTWTAKDVKILDDIAFVSYPEYTDLNREDIDLFPDTDPGQIQLCQNKLRWLDKSYGSINDSCYNFGGLTFRTSQLPEMNTIDILTREGGYDAQMPANTGGDTTPRLSNGFYAMENCILKVEGMQLGTGDEEKRTLYYIYGGNLPRANPHVVIYLPEEDKWVASDVPRWTNRVGGDLDIYLKPQQSWLSYHIQPQHYNPLDEAPSKDGQEFTQLADFRQFSDGDFAGYFFLVDNMPFDQGSPTSIKQSHMESERSGEVHIMLSTCWGTDGQYTGSNQDRPSRTEYLFFDGPRGDQDLEGTMGYSAMYADSIKLIKFTPVRKCGKVDVYQKKSGMFEAIVDNRVTSTRHGLKDGDIVRIDSALWDGTQDQSSANEHPLNNNKFVKVIDSGTFDLYDDQFFESPSYSAKLKSIDGITWTCVGNANGNDAQSWQYARTIFSPTGRNGYPANDPLSGKVAANYSIYDRALESEFTTVKRAGHAIIHGRSGNYIEEETNFNRNHMVFDLFDQGEIAGARVYEDRDEVFWNKDLLWRIYEGDTHNATYYDPVVDARQAGNFGKRIERFLDSVPVSTLGKSPFSLANKSPNDFYPFFCTDDLNEAIDYTNNDGTLKYSPYTGNKFGESMDVKFSHKVGDSSVYVLAVGEPGSDCAVDFFGGAGESEWAADGSMSHVVQSYSSPINYVRTCGKKKVIPSNLPFGKVHLINIYVDKYGRVTNITHENSLSGDGNSLITGVNQYGNGLTNDRHPWHWMANGYGPRAKIGRYITGESTEYEGMQVYYNGITDAGWDDIKNNIMMHDYLAPFYERIYENSSLYWDRAAESAWFGSVVYDYFRNNVDNPGDVIRNNTNATRLNQPTEATNDHNRSRFGETGIGNGVVDSFPRIDRFAFGANNSRSQWYVCPYFDGFGKSVSLHIENDLYYVVGSTNVKSNAVFKNMHWSKDQNTDFQVNLKRPLLPGEPSRLKVTAPRFTITSDETRTQSMQLTCVVYSRTSLIYNITGASMRSFAINSGGAVETTQTVTDQNVAPMENSNVIIPGQYYTARLLRTGDDLGTGLSVLQSLRLSGTSVIFRDGYLIWADHNLNNRTSTINVLKFDGSKFDTFDKASVSIAGQDANGDTICHNGFGADMRYDDGVLITNVLENLDDTGEQVLDSNGNEIYYDTIHVYGIDQNNGIRKIQRITATFDGLDERYSKKLAVDYKDRIINAENMNYENNFVGSKTWNIRMLGRYDIVSNRILFKDPVEYIIFGLDTSYDTVANRATPISTYFSEMTPYFKYQETYYNDAVYYDYSDSGSYKVKDESKISKSGDVYTSTISQTVNPVFFLSLPDVSNRLGDLVITTNRNIDGRAYANVLDIINGNTVDAINSYVPINPSLTLFRKDPRSMIVPNGPVIQGDFDSHVQDGKYKYVQSMDASSEINRSTKFYQPLFRGGANDLFYYGADYGGSPNQQISGPTGIDPYEALYNQWYGGDKTLGELYDLTYDQLGNTDKGIISWNGPDNYTWYEYYDADWRPFQIDPYGAIFGNPLALSATKTQFVIPYEDWRSMVIDTNISPIIKSSADDRPFFGSYDKIRHGTHGSNPTTGTFDDTYDDINRATYDASKINSRYGLILSFTYNGASRVNIANTPETESIITNDPSYPYLRQWNYVSNALKYRYISNYSYTPWFGKCKNNNFNGIEYFAGRLELNQLEFDVDLNDVEFGVNVTTFRKRRYNAKFHKIAYFEYNDASTGTVRRTTLDYNDIESMENEDPQGVYVQTVDQIKRYAFGDYGYVPVPLGLVRLTAEDPALANEGMNKGASKNPIIRLGKSKTNSSFNGETRGVASSSMQVIAIDNIVTRKELRNADNNYFTDIDTSFYVDTNDSDRLIYSFSASGLIGPSQFATQTLIGSFDIQDIEGMSLYIANIPPGTGSMSLHIRDQQSSGILPTSITGIGFYQTDPGNPDEPMSLFIRNGNRLESQGITLKIGPQAGTDVYDNFMSLFTYEIPPSAVMPLVIGSDKADEGSMTLAFAPPGTGYLPMFIDGPRSGSGDATLHIRGKAPYGSSMPLYASGDQSFQQSMVMNVTGNVGGSGSMSLVMNKGFSTDSQEDGSPTLWIVSPYSASGSMSLAMSNILGYYTDTAPLFIGTQYEVHSKGTTLNIDTPPAANSNTKLVIDGYVNTANNLDDTQTVGVLGKPNVLDDTSNDPNLWDLGGNEPRVNLKIGSDILEQANSIIQAPPTAIWDAYALRQRVTELYPETDDPGWTPVKYFASRRKLDVFENVAYSLKKSLGSKSIMGYLREDATQQTTMTNNRFTKKRAISSNGKYVVAGGCSDSDGFELDIYETVDSDTVKRKFSITSQIAGRAWTRLAGVDQPILCPFHGVGEEYKEYMGKHGNKSIIPNYVNGDSFLEIREAIFDYVQQNLRSTADVSNYLANSTSSRSNFEELNNAVIVNGVSVSDLDQVGISLKVKVTYDDYPTWFNVIISFNINDIDNSNPYLEDTDGTAPGNNTSYIPRDKYNFHITYENPITDEFAGNAVWVSKNDVFFDYHRGVGGHVYKMTGDNVSTAVSWYQNSDYDNYANNLVYITADEFDTGFGSTIKVFEETGRRLMFVGAPVYDPYVRNTLNQPIQLSGIGAVFIYAQEEGQTSWTEWATVYGGGWTSYNIDANMDQIDRHNTSDRKVGLFGYDFDYKNGKLLVSEPGGPQTETNNPKIYVFDVDYGTDSITLANTFSASSMSVPDGNGGTRAVNHMDDFGYDVAVFNDLTFVTNWTDYQTGYSVVLSLPNGEPYASSQIYGVSSNTTAEMARDNLNAEMIKYTHDRNNDAVPLEYLERRATIIGMARGKFFGTENLHIIREFKQGTSDLWPSNSLTDFRVNKLSSLNLRGTPFSLFISAPSTFNENVTLHASGFGVPSNSADLSIGGVLGHSANASLYTYFAAVEASLGLHIESPRNSYAPLHIGGSGSRVDGSKSMSLVIPVTPIGVSDMPLHTSGVGLSSDSTNLAVYGNTISRLVTTNPLFIGKDINYASGTSLYMNTTSGLSINDGSIKDGVATLAITPRDSNVFVSQSGAPLHIVGPDNYDMYVTAPLYIGTDIPQTGVAGYMGSGNVTVAVSGSNDGSVYSNSEGYTSLSITSAIRDSGIAPLYIERVFGGLTPLVIKNQQGFGDAPLAVSGAFASDGSISLVVSPPTSNTKPLFTRGYVE